MCSQGRVGGAPAGTQVTAGVCEAVSAGDRGKSPILPPGPRRPPTRLYWHCLLGPRSKVTVSFLMLSSFELITVITPGKFLFLFLALMCSLSYHFIWAPRLEHPTSNSAIMVRLSHSVLGVSRRRPGPGCRQGRRPQSLQRWLGVGLRKSHGVLHTVAWTGGRAVGLITR